MTETLGTQEGEAEQILQAKPQIFKWLGGIWLRPRATLQNILSFEKGVWLIPLLVLSGLQIIKNLVEGPIRSAAAMAALQEKAAKAAAAAMANGGGMVMGGGGGGGADVQMTTGGFTTGPIYNILLPALLGIISIWIVWVLFGSMLHLSLTLAGNRNNASTSLNLMAWASLPVAARLIIQTIATLATGHLIGSPGLSGFVNTAGGGAAAFFGSLLTNVDLFLIWQLVLLVVGAMVMGNISRTKAIFSVVVCALVVLALQAVPGTVTSALSGIATTTTPIF